MKGAWRVGLLGEASESVQRTLSREKREESEYKTVLKSNRHVANRPKNMSRHTYNRVMSQAHEPSMGAGKRQYMSAIFAHTDEQFETAAKVLHDVKQSKTRVSTQVEMATDFYEGEFYHQKWLLQRKTDWYEWDPPFPTGEPRLCTHPHPFPISNDLPHCPPFYALAHLSASACREMCCVFLLCLVMSNS